MNIEKPYLHAKPATTRKTLTYTKNPLLQLKPDDRPGAPVESLSGTASWVHEKP